VALAWVLAQPGVTAPIVGASKVAQLHDSLSALDLHLTPEHLRLLDARSVLDPAHGMSKMLKNAVFGGASIQGWED
jgi:aryl-alcohol dehydrogenase-like predicted oxidoreductase